jgi:hypothetical protein
VLSSNCCTAGVLAPVIFPEQPELQAGKVNRKQQLFFGPPLALLTQDQGNTLEISGRVNRAAERYLEILRFHGLALNDAERAYLIKICGIGFLSPEDIRDLPDEVLFSVSDDPRMNKESKEALAAKLEAASFADLVATIESLGL